MATLAVLGLEATTFWSYEVTPYQLPIPWNCDLIRFKWDHYHHCWGTYTLSPAVPKILNSTETLTCLPSDINAGSFVNNPFVFLCQASDAMHLWSDAGWSELLQSICKCTDTANQGRDASAADWITGLTVFRWRRRGEGKCRQSTTYTFGNKYKFTDWRNVAGSWSFVRFDDQTYKMSDERWWWQDVGGEGGGLNSAAAAAAACLTDPHRAAWQIWASTLTTTWDHLTVF